MTLTNNSVASGFHDKQSDDADPAPAPISYNPSDAECLHSAAELLLPHFEAGKSVDAALIRTVMEDAFGASDGDGAWVWKDAYEAVEAAQVMMLTK
ncbi:MAG: hypothetical protein WBC71_06950, partial [Salaquimonas sp.]